MFNDNGMLVVLNKEEDTTSFIQLPEGETVKTLPMDAHPHEIAVSMKYGMIYIVNSIGESVKVIDLKTLEEIKTIRHDEFMFPHGVGLNEDETELWMASTEAKKVFVISIPDNEVVKIIPTGQRASHMIAFTPDYEKVYVPNIRAGTLTVIDAATKEVLEHIRVGAGPEGVAVHPDGKHVFVANQDDDEVEVLCTSTHKAVSRQQIGQLPVRLVFSPDAKYAFVANRDSRDVSVIDAKSFMEIKRLEVGSWPGGIVFNCEGTFAYVANNKTNDVSVIDVENLVEVKRIPAGIHPDGIGYLPA